MNFGDTAVTTTVLISGTVAPASVTFANSTANYTLGGGVLSGSASLYKSGSDSLTINNVKACTGGSFVTNNGLLDLINGSSSLPSNFMNNGTVLDSSAVRVRHVGVTGTNFNVTIQSCLLHTYQL